VVAPIAVRQPYRVAPRLKPSVLVKPHYGRPPGMALLAGSAAFPSSPLVVHCYAAFGADLTADPGTWVFTELTADLRVPEKPTITRGRSDEAQQAQPAKCTFSLNNQAGDYTPRRAMSQYYPYVRKDTPVKLTVNTGSGEFERFAGFIDTIKPAWDTSGRVRTAAISASGVLRRLGQGEAPIRSALYRSISTTTTGQVAYWPIEDGPSASTAASSVAGVPALSGPGVTFGSTSDLPGASLVALVPAGSYMTATIPTYTDTGEFVIDFWTQLTPVAGPFTRARLLNWTTSGGTGTTKYVSWWLDAEWFSGTMEDGHTGWGVQGYTSDGLTGVSVDSRPAFVGGDAYVNPFDGDWHNIRIRVVQSGTTAVMRILVDDHTATGLNALTSSIGTLNSITIGDPNATSSGYTDAAAVSHLCFYSESSTDRFTDPGAGWSGETADTRLARLCAEESLPCTITGTSDVTMGPQLSLKLLDILRQCETADGGLLGDGVGFGITYETRSSRYNAPPALILDIPSGRLAPPFEPATDDQKYRNDITYKRGSGSTQTGQERRFVDLADVAAHGRYDAQVTANFDTDRPLIQHAAWDVHRGTVDEDRYPVLGFSLAKNPDLISAWTAGGTGRRLVVTGKPDTASDDDIDEFIEGYTETFDPFLWDVAMNCSPASPWKVFTVEDVSRGLLDTAGSQLAVDINTTATSLSVATTSGPIWTTSLAAPIYIDVGGEQIKVTAISGSSSPQTFTVVRSINDVVKAHTATPTTAISLWKPAVLAL